MLLMRFDDGCGVVRTGNMNLRTFTGSKLKTRKRGKYADYQPVDPQATDSPKSPEQGSCAEPEPAETWGLHPRLHDHAKETELGDA